jgi:hypothetical protein
MKEELSSENQSEEQKYPLIFRQRLDIYGQALAIYVVLFVVFAVFRGTIEEGEFSIKLFTPVVMLMFAIVLISCFTLIMAAVKRKEIIWTEDYLEVRNRFHIKHIPFSDIVGLKITSSPTRYIRGEAGFVRIKIRNKKKIVFIRSASYWKNRELLKLFDKLQERFVE